MPSNSSLEQRPATLDDVVAALSSNQNALEEMLMWLRISGVEKAKNTLQSTLDTPEKRLVYQLSDGKTTREINAACGASIATISTYWKKWYRLGLMKKAVVKGGGERHFRSFDLDDYGIEVPKIAPKEVAPAASPAPFESGGA